MEKTLQPWSSFVVLPLFALANAGIAFSVDSIWPLDRLSLGIIFGLVIGKPLGIVLATWLVERLGLGRKPDDTNWSHIVAVGFLCGIGFTMSIFITNEAFEADQKIATAKLAVMIASVLAALCGMIWLSVFSRLKLTVRPDS
jgi:NhaA family Na+:H+ antiporter